MANPILFLSLLTLISVPTNHAYSRTVSKEQLGIKDDQQTKLTFYYHDTLTGSNPTSIQIAKASGSNNSPSTFGSLSIIDNPLTETSDITSKVVGRAQGLNAMSDQNGIATTMIMNLYFTESDYNGSTLCVLARSAVNDKGLRELPVIGGTGMFRFAKGYAQAKTQTFDQKTGNSVVEYNVFVTHSSSTGSGGDSGDSPSDDGGSSSGSPSKSGSSSPKAAASHGSLSNMVSLSFLLIPLLYLCIV